MHFTDCLKNKIIVLYPKIVIHPCTLLKYVLSNIM